MKRSLVIGCAAVALSTGCGSAFADEFQVKLGGDAHFVGGVATDSDAAKPAAGLRSVEFTNRFRLNIIPSAKADNGLQYGARLRLRASRGTNVVDVDKAFLFIEGSFGRFELGQTGGVGDTAAYLSTMDDYSAGGLGAGIDGPAIFDGLLGGSTTGTYLANSAPANYPRGLQSGDGGTRIQYWSPRFSGFQLGATYQPRNDSLNTDVNRLKLGGGAYSGKYDDIWEIGANYNNTFGDITLDGDLSYIGGTARKAAVTDKINNLGSMKVGADIKYKQFKFGASYMNGWKSGIDKTLVSTLVQDQQTFVVGVAYIEDKYQLGFNYQRIEDSGHTDQPGRVNVDVYTVGGSYTIAPGLATSLEYNHINLKAKAPSTIPTDNANVFLVRTTLTF